MNNYIHWDDDVIAFYDYLEDELVKLKEDDIKKLKGIKEEKIDEMFAKGIYTQDMWYKKMEQDEINLWRRKVCKGEWFLTPIHIMPVGSVGGANGTGKR